MRIVDSGAASSCRFVSLVHSCKLHVPEYVLLDVCAQPVSARDRLEAATGRICKRYHVKSPRACDPSAPTPPECSVLAADQYAVVMTCICDELEARHVTRRPWQLLISYARHRENALPGELRMRRSGLACDRCIPYMSASSEPPTVLVQCLQGPVPFTRMCPSLACDCHRNKPAVPAVRRETHSQTALPDAGVFKDVPAKRSCHCGAAVLQSTSGQLDSEG